MEDRFTIEELSKKLKVSTRTLQREIKRGNLPAQKVGRRYLILKKDLDDYLNKGNKDIKKSISDYLEGKKPEMINLLQKMVALPSVGYKSGNEEVFADFIGDTLSAQDIRTSVQKENDVVSVRASFGYADNGFLLDCPLDTTPIGDINKWTYPPYGGVIKNNKMYGRGTADSKAGIVSMIYALLALKRVVDEKDVRVELVFDGGEQDGSYSGMQMALKRGLYVDAGIIGYASDEFTLPIGARGYHRYTFKTKGKASHTGARFNKGINAIEQMVKFINEMYKCKLPKSNNRYFSFGQRMTFSVIKGGVEINLVPDECISRMDFRTTPDYHKDFVDKLIKTTINELKKKDKNFEIEYKYDVGNEGYILNEDTEIINVLKKSVKDVMKKSVPLSATGPSHIGTILYEEGIPVVLWGPKGGNVHSYDEYVDIESISKTSEVYVRSILKYFNVD